jgi:hypothetical protein
VSGFSEDGQWWWDGRQWIPTSQVVIPDLAVPQSPITVRWARNRQLLGDINQGTLWQETILSLPFIFVERRAFRELRKWSLEQLSSAAAYLLGPDEPMVAGETSLFRPILSFFSYTAYRDLAVLVTTAHVLVLRFDRFDGQPRWVLLAARPQDVRLEASGTVVGAHTTIVVSHGVQRFPIKGTARIAQAEPVLAAWRLAVSGTARTE